VPGHGSFIKIFNYLLKLFYQVILILNIKMSQHVTSFPWRDLKIFPLDMSQQFIYDPYMGLACHGMSQVITACHRISCDKGGVTNQQA
jgi:hypothetical protein